jgi:hypothetical protein
VNAYKQINTVDPNTYEFYYAIKNTNNYFLTQLSKVTPTKVPSIIPLISLCTYTVIVALFGVIIFHYKLMETIFLRKIAMSSEAENIENSLKAFYLMYLNKPIDIPDNVSQASVICPNCSKFVMPAKYKATRKGTRFQYFLFFLFLLFHFSFTFILCLADNSVIKTGKAMLADIIFSSNELAYQSAEILYELNSLY